MRRLLHWLKNKHEFGLDHSDVKKPVYEPKKEW
jgi:hypothetical protein